MNIAIIGNGIAGTTAARYIRKLSNHNITLISSESDYFFSRTALMYIYMGHMRQVDTQPYEPWFWEKNRIDLLKAHVEKIDFDNKTLHFSNGSNQAYDKLILATGSTPNKFGWPGQDLNRVGGLYSLQDLEAMEAGSEGLERAVIVGGGLIGIEMAEMFASRDIPVTFLVREKSFWNRVIPPEESAMINRHIKEHHIDLRLSTEMDRIEDDGEGNACAVYTKDEERIECGYVGLTAGVHPNIDFLKGTKLETNRGILVNNHLETNIPDVYAIGDCSEQREPDDGRRGIEAIWYTGRMAGEVCAYNICDKPVEYHPGIWFNSAKFLDIEYQVYGDMPAHVPDHQDTIYWEHPDGKKSIRINFDKMSMSVTGFNLMGVRYRHEVCEQWIMQMTHIESVLQNLGLANFDPEFYNAYEKEVIQVYNEKMDRKIRLRTKRGLKGAIKFLKQARFRMGRFERKKMAVPEQTWKSIDHETANGEIFIPHVPKSNGKHSVQQADQSADEKVESP
ncbi:MAG: FAD/NAD(P)-binding oxidoreductase [Bacteroidota bacterium]